MNVDSEPRLSPLEVFGLKPFFPALRQCWQAISGDGLCPPTRWGLSSLKIFKPSTSLPLWFAPNKRRSRVPVYNFVNRNGPAPGQAYSVKVTDCEDFQGGQWTYDGHVGTDFACPIKTPICSVAPGRVILIKANMNRGGLKVIVDHGNSLIASYNHLSRALVTRGQPLARGEILGLSGMSGVDGLLFFPWLAPHLHLTLFANGRHIDPFARPTETSLWLKSNDPEPWDGHNDLEFQDSQFNIDLLSKVLASCKNKHLAQRLGDPKQTNSEAKRREIGFEIFFAMSFFSPWFTTWDNVFTSQFKPHPHLSLPFRPDEYSGCELPANPAGSAK